MQSLCTYLQNNSIIYRNYREIKAWILKFIREVHQVDGNTKPKKMVWRILLFHGVIVLICTCGWFFALPIFVIYFGCLYYYLMRYMTQVQNDYNRVLDDLQQMSQGNLNITSEDSYGIFQSIKEEIETIRVGFKIAVDEEVKSEKMKTELITNVSHDLKTPLTAIITYIELLKAEGITEEQRAQYISAIDRKSMRLKHLIEDLFEISKANAQTITLNLEKIDVSQLLLQTTYELEEKMEDSKIDFRISYPEQPVQLMLDGAKTYRIFENLIGNITKYGFAGTRAYVDVTEDDKTVCIAFRNISKEELNVDTKSLTERFVRGDESRNTEGSGLGLAIVKSFTEIQGGMVEIQVDGDLFKITLKFPSICNSLQSDMK